MHRRDVAREQPSLQLDSERGLAHAASAHDCGHGPAPPPDVSHELVERLVAAVERPLTRDVRAIRVLCHGSALRRGALLAVVALLDPVGETADAYLPFAIAFFQDAEATELVEHANG
jgi:hypothetical protein